MSPRSESRALWMTIIIAALSLIISGYVGYSSTTDTDHQRLKGVEVQQDNDGKRLERMELKLDHLIENLLGEKPR